MEMRIRIKHKFMNPRTNRMSIIDSEMNVPVTGFWLRRLNDGDCEKIKAESRTGPKAEPKKYMKKDAKRSK